MAPNILYASAFVLAAWAPFLAARARNTTQPNPHASLLSPLHAAVTLFNAINALICTWEIALFRHRDLIRNTYLELKAKYGQRLPPGFVLLDSAPLADALTLRHWSKIWSTYALLDPSYADKASFGFWIDVGNGCFFLLPSLMMNLAISIDSGLPPRLVALCCVVFNYVMLHGTVLYFCSYLLNQRYRGCTSAGVTVVILANGLWVAFPALAIYSCTDVVLRGSWQIFE